MQNVVRLEAAYSTNKSYPKNVKAIKAKASEKYTRRYPPFLNIMRTTHGLQWNHRTPLECTSLVVAFDRYTVEMQSVRTSMCVVCIENSPGINIRRYPPRFPPR